MGNPDTVAHPQEADLATSSSGLAELWEYRDLLITLTQHRIRVRYKQSVLGVGWAIAQPLAQMAILSIVFSHFVRVPSDGLPYTIFVLCSLLPWQFFSSAIQSGSTCLVAHSDLIRKVGFPREIIPLTYVLAGLFDFAVTLVLLLGMMLWYRLPLPATALWSLPLLAVLGALTTALTLGLSAMQARVRDVSYVVPLLLQMGIYSVPVLYPVSAVPERWRSLYSMNPLVPLIDGFRSAWLKGSPPDLTQFAQASLVTAVLLIAAYFYFRYVETTMADYL